MLVRSTLSENFLSGGKFEWKARKPPFLRDWVERIDLLLAYLLGIFLFCAASECVGRPEPYYFDAAFSERSSTRITLWRGAAVSNIASASKIITSEDLTFHPSRLNSNLAVLHRRLCMKTNRTKLMISKVAWRQQYIAILENVEK